VKIIHPIFVLLLLATVAYASTVPPIDDPGTAFNESDTAVTLAPPAAAHINFGSPAMDSLIPPNSSPGWIVHNPANELAPVPSQCPPHSFQKMLCTFLI
jgi:hypothetical protein